MERKLKVGITHGDYNGVSYEIILKTLTDPRILELYTPVIYGIPKVFSYFRKRLKLGDLNVNIVNTPDQISSKRINLVQIGGDEDYKIELGNSTLQAGQVAYQGLVAAVEDLKKGNIDVVVTAPINKSNIQSESFNFPGHTEYFATQFKAKEPLMFMCHNNLRVGVATGHIPITKVSSALTQDLIERKLEIMHSSLERDFGINKPKIAVLGLNPHAGDDGLLGSEEIEIIIPAIEHAKSKGNKIIHGPFPADGFFGSNNYTKYDAILAMYHDQGLIPFKALAAGEGVNFTTGLPIVRTSCAHGTAYSIAGENIASERSFLDAIYLALDVHKNREEYDELNSNPLPFILLEEMERGDIKDEDLPDAIENEEPTI